MDATLPRDFHHAREPDACELLGCPTGSAMARHIDHLTDQLGTQRARADRLDAELAKANAMITVHTCGPDCRKTTRCAEVADLRAEVEVETVRADAMERAGAEQARRADENLEAIRALRAEVEALRATPPHKREDLRCVIADLTQQCQVHELEIEHMRAERDMLLSDWNAIVAASGSKTHGGAIGHVAAMRRKVADGEAAVERRLLGNMVALPEFMVDGSIPKALEVLHRRIEALPASLEATAASSLCRDLLAAVNGDRYAQDHVCSVIATIGQEKSK